jgi:acetyltransferase-like isoleucine patch superfamily enzyme
MEQIMYNDILAKHGLFVVKGHEPMLPFKFERNVNLGTCQIFPGCMIGTRTYINSAIIRENVIIGRYCSVGRSVTIGSPFHNYNALSTSPFFTINSSINIQKYADKNNNYSVIIGNDVWIGDKVFISSGVIIGDGAVIGAGSIVTKNIDPYGIAYGNPAIVHKYRFDKNIISSLEKIKWYEFDSEKLKLLDAGNIDMCIDLIQKWPDADRIMKNKVYIELKKT